ncbi:MAG: hypothetical protein FJ303_09355 [Planctomycetes bacterium]|nr:hypothetical protein [Planctomycetota bacterium]
MTIEQMRQAREVNPFRPFTIHLADGRSLYVPHRDYVSMSPGGRTVIVYQANEVFSIIDLYLVTELTMEEAPKAPGKSGT